MMHDRRASIPTCKAVVDSCVHLRRLRYASACTRARTHVRTRARTHARIRFGSSAVLAMTLMHACCALTHTHAHMQACSTRTHRRVSMHLARHACHTHSHTCKHAHMPCHGRLCPPAGDCELKCVPWCGRANDCGHWSACRSVLVQ